VIVTIGACACAMSLLLSAPAAAQVADTTALTLNAAMERALAANATIAAAHMRGPIDLAGLAVARDRLNPEASVEIEKEAPKHSFALALPLEIGGKRAKRIAVSEATVHVGELTRENLRPMAVVSGRLEGRDLGSAVGEIQTNLNALALPIGYTYEIGGQFQSQTQAFREPLMIFALAVVLVFTILVIQFRAWVPAILILLAAPLSLGGALLLLRLTGTDLNIASAMGIILLVGLVVKNGIMLLDFSEKLHQEGEPFDTAIAHAGRIRLRRILMTTFCTLFGLLPLALGLGAGAELQKLLALAVIGGLALSTPVTLLVVPGLYAAIKGRP
jgi:multidrug efflux pump subunit AcrB